MPSHTRFQELCVQADKRGMRLELHTNHKSSAALEPSAPAPQVDRLVVKTHDNQVLADLRAHLGALDECADDVLRQLVK